MPNTERIAELKRIAYGAGSTDAERRAALDELDELRHGLSDRHPAASVVPATPDSGVPTPETGALEAGAVETGAIADGAELPARPARPARARGRRTAVTATPGATPMDLPAAPPPGSFVDVDETRVVEVFEREPTEAELAPDPILFSGFDVDDAGPRLLATRSDGLTVWAARTVEGDLCVVMRIDESSSGGGCTHGGLFPAVEGIGIETYHESLGNHSAFLDQWGDLRMRVDGVSGGPRT